MTLYTVEECAALLRLSKSKIYELTDEGKLGFHRFDGAKRISQKHIDDYLAQTESEPHEAAPQLAVRPGLRRLKL